MRTLLILDGTKQVDEALANAAALCDPGDKLTVLAVAEKPPAAMIGSEPAEVNQEPYTGGTVGGFAASGAPDRPVLEPDDETAARVAGELRDELDEHVAELRNDGIELWTQAIVRDQPGEAVAEYVRSSDFARITLPKSALPHLRELMGDSEGRDALEGRLAPVIVLPA